MARNVKENIHFLLTLRIGVAQIPQNQRVTKNHAGAIEDSGPCLLCLDLRVSASTIGYIGRKRRNFNAGSAASVKKG
jgi:hypothetical protein